ncbi:hypothetical protein [[Clostridium] polysaccharolyticum]|uniref:Uncharacterized protein n=1 Tax=[Clostridium] polysaccharolyticum TaxID=29364 RepID=A0A1I0ETU9_9FIRM|nr:hypothetical protein [[Clostridium] polysaccharolyticum]SET48025.1 hypothetical protein SAMN04487772_12416 [[Clostridium] polysaccharolyticum]
MKKLNRVVAIAGLTIIVAGISIELGASKKSFSFEFSSSVVGRTEFDFSDGKAKCNAQADTYRYGTGEVLRNKYRYKLSLEKKSLFGKTYAGNTIYADGCTHTVSFQSIKEGTYTVNIGSPDSLASKGAIIKGTGVLYQE